MYVVYILYSHSGDKTYVGFTNNFERRLQEHNITASKDFTLRYRPWIFIHSEIYHSKQEALQKEKFYKTGRGGEEIKNMVNNYLNRDGAISAAAEMD